MIVPVSAVMSAALLALPTLNPCVVARTIAFTNADVLTLAGAAPEWLRSHTVVVREGRIAAVSTAAPPADACVVAAHGKVLLPGLADMHAHMSATDLPIFLATGVTLVREMNGTARHLTLRDRLARGELAGPRLLVASPLLTGKVLRYRHQLIDDAGRARAVAVAAADSGYDFLKVYDDLSRESYAALVEVSRAKRVRLDGHVPAAVGLEAVLASGQAIQHVDKIAFALAGHSADTSRLVDARRLFAGRTVWVTPTLASLRALDGAGTAAYAEALGRPETALVDPELVAWWRSLARNGNRAYSPSSYYRFQTALLRTLQQIGVRFLLGTDASNPLMVPGYSVHDELQALVHDAGFTPWEALLTATRNAAEFMGDVNGGRIAVGARAELLLVDGNPLADLATLRGPLGVMAGGVWYTRAQLEKMVTARHR